MMFLLSELSADDAGCADADGHTYALYDDEEWEADGDAGDTCCADAFSDEDHVGEVVECSYDQAYGCRPCLSSDEFVEWLVSQGFFLIIHLVGHFLLFYKCSFVLL